MTVFEFVTSQPVIEAQLVTVEVIVFVLAPVVVTVTLFVVSQTEAVLVVQLLVGSSSNVTFWSFPILRRYTLVSFALLLTRSQNTHVILGHGGSVPEIFHGVGHLIIGGGGPLYQEFR